MEKVEPLVSILVPCYNHSNYVKECIVSIINQTYTNYELIVIDDGSTDNSVEILEKLSKEFNFRLFAQKNKGISATLNRGIKEFSSGKYITFCASDDFWAENKLEKQVRFMEENSNIPMCFGKVHYVDVNSKIIDRLDRRNDRLKGGRLFDDILLFKIHPPVNYMFKKSIFDEVGYYDESEIVEDYDMNLRISSKYSIGFIDEYLSFYRVGNSIERFDRFISVIDSQIRILKKYKNKEKYSKAVSKSYLRRSLLKAKKKNHKFSAISDIIKSGRIIDRYMLIIIYNLVFNWNE
ncbi:glycosyltransferase [Nonlabens sp.]|uniref:glycosyltransferase family 2 protein n=1 Tax=Nonlabens sp. TaxID=1888209 RepID=UPI001BCD9E7A|nr:glycosyltransferase [Nonlabens sp.]